MYTISFMKCPICDHPESRVVDSRVSQSDSATRRRRECLSCSSRFTTYERVEEIWPKVVKKDGRRESYIREKVAAGIQLACQKRPIAAAAVDKVVQAVELRIIAQGEPEIESSLVGNWVMEELKQLDKIAYIRFASVYREFQDAEEFVKELRLPDISARD